LKGDQWDGNCEDHQIALKSLVRDVYSQQNIGKHENNAYNANNNAA